MEPLGLSRNRDKCQLHDPSVFHDDLVDHCIQAHCQYIRSEKGIIVCGAPVDQQLDNLRRIFLTPNGVFKKDTQAIELIDFFATDL